MLNATVPPADNTLLKSAIEQAKAAFLVQMGVNSAMQTDAAPSGEGETGTGGLEPDVASSVREYHRRFHNAMGNDPTAGKPHANATVRTTAAGALWDGGVLVEVLATGGVFIGMYSLGDGFIRLILSPWNALVSTCLR